VYRADVLRLDGAWRADEAVTVVDPAGGVLGRGFYNPRTQIACRLMSREDVPIDRAFFERRLDAARRLRAALARDGDAERVVFGEGDRLPGLVLDRYGDVVVLQALTLGIEAHAATLAELAAEVTGARAVYRRTDPAADLIEGLQGHSGWLFGEAELEVEIREGPCRFRVALAEGHKTGFYLDQRDNRAAVAALAAGREVLDAFCYTGAFGVQALRHGAASVLALDASAEACARARAHAAANGGERFEAREQNAFDALRELERSGRRFDLVVLDPPPFTRRKTAVEAALRGYKEINLRGLRCLRPGGILATFSCSHHVSAVLFEEVCRAAAADAGRDVRVRAYLTQAPDHPVLLAVPETRYLKGLLLEA
jgi:23S rRNA (cytosine1962-C5)-methyltransferase